VINEPTFPPPHIHSRASSAAVKVESEADLDGGDIIEAQRGGEGGERPLLQIIGSYRYLPRLSNMHVQVIKRLI